jgi:uncharacterized protein (DUF433 family)
MSLTITPQTVPLHIDEHGVARVGGTRVTLESVIAVFKQGSTPEGIVNSFPTLRLPDVYSVLAYFLANRQAVEDYLREQEVEGDRIQAEIESHMDPHGIRDRLLERRKTLLDRSDVSPVRG